MFYLVSILTTIFITLKIVSKIDWSWWWVFSPMWIWIGFEVIIGGLTIIIEVLKSERNLLKRERIARLMADKGIVKIVRNEI